MKTSRCAVPGLVAAAVLIAPAWMHAADAAAPEGASASATAGQPGGVYTGEGRVNHVNAADRELNISHGPIPALKWPAMTMDIPVKDQALLDKVKQGDKVRFQLERTGPTDYRIVGLEVLESQPSRGKPR